MLGPLLLSARSAGAQGQHRLVPDVRGTYSTYHRGPTGALWQLEGQTPLTFSQHYKLFEQNKIGKTVFVME